jgi:hypothetical protein
VGSGNRTLAVVAFSVVALSALAGCREDEQNRPLIVEKGVYQGAPDQELSEAERRALQQRGDRQRF